MISDEYSKAYKEVLEIIKYFPEEEYAKIPKEKIDFYKENMDNDYEFSIDPEIDLDKQNVSDIANTIIVSLYLDYFATEEQKIKINKILDINEQKVEEEKREKYNPDDLFKKKKNNDIQEQKEIHETALVEYKESFFIRFKNFILSLFHANN